MRYSHRRASGVNARTPDGAVVYGTSVRAALPGDRTLARMFQATPAKGLVFGFDVVRREDQHLQPRPAFVQHAVQPFSRSAIGPALCGARSSSPRVRAGTAPGPRLRNRWIDRQSGF